MTTTERKNAKRDTLNLRIKPELRGLMDRAAALLGKNRTDFVLAAAGVAAEDTLLDCAVFAVNAEAYSEFVKRLDAPPEYAPMSFAKENTLLVITRCRTGRANLARQVKPSI